MNIFSKQTFGFQMVNIKKLDEKDVLNYIKECGLVFGKIRDDSRDVEAGDLYIAIPPLNGASSKPYISEALKKGAQIVITDCNQSYDHNDEKLSGPALWITVETPRLAKAILASQVYPERPSHLFGVTGTNGKSSVAYFVHQLCEYLGERSAFIGTTGYEGPEAAANVLPREILTSVDSIDLHQFMDGLHRKRVNCLSLEASSHGLDQYRLDGLQFSAAGFTNIQVDHLDYHKTFENYCKAKERLFHNILSPKGVAVINADVPYADRMIKAAGSRRVITYGVHSKDIQIVTTRYCEDAQEISMRFFGQEYTIKLPLVGDFQAMNALCALGMVYAVFGRLEDCLKGLETLKAVSGRMQKAGKTQGGGLVYIDYAQNSDGMKTALNAIRPYVKNKLTVLFGCGGGRDLSRRQGMGKAAYEGADRVIITDDNPRYESPKDIRESLMQTCPGAIEIPDRKQAIHFALSTLNAGDVCLIAGKGHERYEIIGDQKIPYNDFEEAQKQIKSLGGVCS